jgi:3-hydroxybutyryl-CoA dehydrogenase
MAEIAVVGSGTMGHALALVFALGGHRVRLTDNAPAVRDRALGLMQGALATLIQAGEVGSEWTAERLRSAVRVEPGLAETVVGAELVIEAIIEQPAAKRALFDELDALLDEAAILASNTSYLNVFPLVPERRLPRFLIMHWYTPPYLVDLVDIVGGPTTEPAVIESCRAIVTAMGKVPIVLAKFIPGYIANRIQQAITLEVNRLLDEGYATPRQIDDAVIHGLALRIPVLGHLAKADFTGLSLMQDVIANRIYEPPPVRTRSETLDALLAEGRGGVGSGRGYFDWGGRSPSELFAERDRRLLALKRAMREIGPLIGD